MAASGTPKHNTTGMYSTTSGTPKHSTTGGTGRRSAHSSSSSGRHSSTSASDAREPAASAQRMPSLEGASLCVPQGHTIALRLCARVRVRGEELAVDAEEGCGEDGGGGGPCHGLLLLLLLLPCLLLHPRFLSIALPIQPPNGRALPPLHLRLRPGPQPAVLRSRRLRHAPRH
jgi:hypothetical protein